MQICKLKKVGIGLKPTYKRLKASQQGLKML